MITVHCKVNGTLAAYNVDTSDITIAIAAVREILPVGASALVVVK